MYNKNHILIIGIGVSIALVLIGVLQLKGVNLWLEKIDQSIVDAGSSESIAVGGPTQNSDPTAIVADFPPGTVKVVDLFAATTTGATSTPTRIAGAKKVSLVFTNDPSGVGGNYTFLAFVTGNSTTTNATNDGNYIQFNKLVDNVTNSNSQNLTRVASATNLATSSKIYSLDLANDTVTYLKCAAYEITNGGNASCKAVIEY